MFFCHTLRNASFVRLLGLLTGLLVLLVSSASVVADRSSSWTVPKRIPDYHNLLSAPYLVADHRGLVHAFSYERIPPQPGAIFYRHWTPEEDWSSRIDIVLPATGSTSVQGAFVDHNDRLHLIYFNGDELEGDIYYSTAEAAEAGSLQGWSEPVPVGPKAGPVAAAAVGGDGHGKLVIVYSGQVSAIGLYEVHSTDNGRTWSEPATVSIVDRPDREPVAVWLESDDRGRFHVVWHVANDVGQGEEIRYARLETDLVQWGHVTILARRDTDLENMGWGSIISSGDELMVLYQDGFPATRWMQRSSDGGETWAKPIRPFSYIGGYNYTALIKDSSNTIHMVLGNRWPSPEIHGMWYSRFVDNAWTPLEAIISGPSTNSFDPCCPRIVISRGNVLLATWAHNVRNEFLTGAWYSYRFLDAPELLTALPPTATVLKTTPILVTPTRTWLTPTPTTQSITKFQSGSGYISPVQPIFVGIVPILIISIAMIIIRYFRRSST